MSRPNFLVFCLDQVQAASFGCNGNPVVKTPNIDKLAASGTNFTRSYCSNPVCMPCRASFITGLMPRQHGLLTNGTLLPENTPTITQALVDNGYRTHSVGKLHFHPFGAGREANGPTSLESRAVWVNGDVKELPSPYYGYQTSDFVGGHVSYIFGDYENWLEESHPGMREKYRPEQAYYQKGEAYRMDLPPELHYNNWIADKTIDFLANHDTEQPFFLFCSFPDPHFPFAACKPYSEMYDPASVDIPETYENGEDPIPFLSEYRKISPKNVAPDEDELREIIAQSYGMITHVDDNIGRVLDNLKNLGLDDNTIVVLTADHGEYLGGHDLLKKGAFPIEELWRIPLIWRVPGAETGVCDTPVSTVDFVVTVCDMLGIDPGNFTNRGCVQSENLRLPGKSLMPLFRGDDLASQPVLIEYDEDFHEGPLIRLRGLIVDNMKLVQYYGSDQCVLIDLAKDPQELNNLWDHPDYRDIQMKMITELSAQLIATDRFDTRRVCGA